MNIITNTAGMHTSGMPVKHAMIDLETLGTNSKAPVIQIGVVFFTVEGILLQSQLTVDFDDAIEHGEADGSTIKWWLERPKETQQTLFDNQRPIVEVADALEKLLEAQNASYYWAHATFDFPILQSMFRSLKRKYPIPYRRSFDLRTLEFAAGEIEWEKRDGIYHNALDDATYQAKHAIKMLQKLKRG